jgi:hypothetical protein
MAPAARTSGASQTSRLRRWGGWLDSNLILESPPTVRPDRKRVALGLALALAGVLVILLRLGWSKPLDSVWAEDGAVFLAGAVSDDLVGAVTTTYADYLHLVPRLLAELAALAPLEWAPELLSVLGAAVVVLCAFVVWRASAAHLPDPRLRGTLAAMVVLLPVVGYESLANLAYVSWFMLFASFWLLLWRPASLWRAIAGGLFVALTVASNPLGLLLLPIAAARAMAFRGGRDAAIIGGLAAGSVAQGIALAFDQSQSPVTADADAELVPTYLLRVVGGLLGQNVDAAAWLVAGWAFVAALALAFAVLVAISVARRDAPGRALSALAIALSITIFFVSGYQRDLAETMMWPADDATTTGARHTIVPVLLLITVVLVQLQRRPKQLTELAWRRIRLGALGAIALVALSAFYVGNDFRFEPRWSSELAAAERECIEESLPAVDVPVAPVGWFARLPCSEIS